MAVKISIVCPTHNGARWIARAIKSVRAQSFSDWEMLVIDDGSTDETSQVVSQFLRQDKRIRLIKNKERTGVQKASQSGLVQAKGEFVARLDDDDFWLDFEKLAYQYEFLRSRPDYGLVGTGAVVCDESGKELYRFIGPQTDEEIREKILYRNCFTNSSILFRRELAVEVGGYRGGRDMEYLEDYDLTLRIGTKAKLANLAIYAVQYTFRESSLSGKNKLEQLNKHSRLIEKYKEGYPNYRSAKLKSRLRYYLYFLFGRFAGKALRHFILKRYKS